MSKSVRVEKVEEKERPAHELRFPVDVAPPPAPRLSLPDALQAAWLERVREATARSLAADEDRWRRLEPPAEAGPSRAPPLAWYGAELLACGQPLATAWKRIPSLEAATDVVDAGGPLWYMLLEVTQLFGAVGFHLHRVVHDLVTEAPQGLRQLRPLWSGEEAPQEAGEAGGAKRAEAEAQPGGSVVRFPPPPYFAPDDAAGALALLKTDLARAQALGARLGAALRLLGQAAPDSHGGAAAARALLAAGEEDRTHVAPAFLLVPALEHAIQKLLSLVIAVDSWAASHPSQQSLLQERSEYEASVAGPPPAEGQAPEIVADGAEEVVVHAMLQTVDEPDVEDS